MATANEAQQEAQLRGLEEHIEDKPEGPISAAIIAGGIGAFALGLLTTLAEANETISGWLELKVSVGPLSGKTTFAVLIWLVAWAVLHVAMKDKGYETRRAFTIAIVLVALGVIATFPTFFQLFAVE
jgi:fluoride ion exporter CrcB/FEX